MKFLNTWMQPSIHKRISEKSRCVLDVFDKSTYYPKGLFHTSISYLKSFTTIRNICDNNIRAACVKFTMDLFK